MSGNDSRNDPRKDSRADARQAELLAAYVDGVSELTADERREVEALLARSAEARDDETATRDMLGQLRALPPVADQPGSEPDWTALERGIRAAVAPLSPLPWWRRARWLVPIGALAATAALAALWLRGSHRAGELDHPGATAPAIAHATDDRGTSGSDVGTPGSAAIPAASHEPQAIYVAGEIVDVADLNGDGERDPKGLLGEIDRDARDALRIGDDSHDVTGGILPSSDLGWIDGLDDSELDRAETWLAKAAPEPPASPDPTRTPDRSGAGSGHGKKS